MLIIEFRVGEISGDDEAHVPHTAYLNRKVQAVSLSPPDLMKLHRHHGQLVQNEKGWIVRCDCGRRFMTVTYYFEAYRILILHYLKMGGRLWRLKDRRSSTQKK